MRPEIPSQKGPGTRNILPPHVNKQTLVKHYLPLAINN